MSRGKSKVLDEVVDLDDEETLPSMVTPQPGFINVRLTELEYRGIRKFLEATQRYFNAVIAQLDTDGNDAKAKNSMVMHLQALQETINILDDAYTMSTVPTDRVLH